MYNSYEDICKNDKFDVIGVVGILTIVIFEHTIFAL
jgi:hypothetical protein